MKLVVGLGNPGKKYEGSRHNVGFSGVDLLGAHLHIHEGWQESKKGRLVYRWCEIDGMRIELVKSQTFMNNTGVAVRYVFTKHQNLRPEDMYVIHDDLDIPLGMFKIQYGKGPRQHNGLQSIYERFGSKQFWHVRIGIENRKLETGNKKQESMSFGRRISGEMYVLQRFTDEERVILEAVMKNVLDELIQRLHKD